MKYYEVEVRAGNVVLVNVGQLVPPRFKTWAESDSDAINIHDFQTFELLAIMEFPKNLVVVRFGPDQTRVHEKTLELGKSFTWTFTDHEELAFAVKALLLSEY